MQTYGSKQGPNNSFWKGGRYKDSRGYMYIWSPDHPYKNSKSYVFEHRLIMEKQIGRYLIPNVDDVHHINGVKDDNRLENLELLGHGKHSTLTHTKDMSDRICVRCKRDHAYFSKRWKGRIWSKRIKEGWLCSSCYSYLFRQ